MIHLFHPVKRCCSNGLILTCCLLSVTYSKLTLAEWKMLTEENGISVHTQSVEGSAYKAFKATLRIKARVDSLLAVILDTEACPDWVHQCTQPKLLEKISFFERYTYQVNDLPWPVDDRDVVAHVLVSQLEGGGNFRVEMIGEPGYLPRSSDYVRVPKMLSTFELRTHSDAGVEVTWTQHLEPGGSIPAWLADAFLKDMPLNTLAGLKTMAKKDKYRDARLIYVDRKAVAFE